MLITARRNINQGKESVLIDVGMSVNTRGCWLVHKRSWWVQGEVMVNARGKCWFVQEGVVQ